MPNVTIQEIKEQVKKGTAKPVYFLYGNEPFFIDQASDYLEHHVLTPEEAVFNKIILYGRDSTVQSVADEVRRYPMMATKQMVMLKEAQSLKSFNDLLPLIEKPVESTIFVIVYRNEKMDKRLSIFKKLSKTAQVFHGKSIYENNVVPWINTYVKQKNIQIAANASQLLVQYLGTDLKKIANAIDQIAISANGKEINEADVSQTIGISREYNVFELQESLGERNIKKTFRIMELMTLNIKSNPVPMVVPALFGYFSKLIMLKNVPRGDMNSAKKITSIHSEFIVKKYIRASAKYSLPELRTIINLLRKADLKSKAIGQVTIPPEEIMRDLIIKMISIG